MRAVRVIALALGVAGATYGLWLVLGLGLGQVAEVLGWVVAGIVVHDGFVAPVVVVIGVAVAVRAPTWRVPLLWTVVVLGPLTLVAVPVLGRFGARPDNPTLLDRPYWLGYAAVVVLVVGAIGVTPRALASTHARPRVTTQLATHQTVARDSRRRVRAFGALTRRKTQMPEARRGPRLTTRSRVRTRKHRRQRPQDAGRETRRRHSEHLIPLVLQHLQQHVHKGTQGLLFPSSGGEHLRASAIGRSYDPARQAAGRPDLRFHDLRHPGRADVPPRHTTPAAAVRYQHAAPERDREIAKRMSQRYRETPTPATRKGHGLRTA